MSRGSGGRGKHALRISADVEQLVSDIDDAHAARLEVPPMMQQGVAMLLLGVEVLRAQETGEPMQTVTVPGPAQQLDRRLAPHGRHSNGFPVKPNERHRQERPA